MTVATRDHHTTELKRYKNRFTAAYTGSAWGTLAQQPLEASAGANLDFLCPGHWQSAACRERVEAIVPVAEGRGGGGASRFITAQLNEK